MAVELKVPSVGESVTEVEIGEWLKREGDHVEKDENLVVIETSDALLVSTRERADDVRIAVEQLKKVKRTEPAIHRRVYRPWGYYESIDAGDGFHGEGFRVEVVGYCGACAD